MPIISVFFGIIVRMYYKEHEPGHFHAEHQGRTTGCIRALFRERNVLAISTAHHG